MSCSGVQGRAEEDGLKEDWLGGPLLGHAQTSGRRSVRRKGQDFDCRRMNFQGQAMTNIGLQGTR